MIKAASKTLAAIDHQIVVTADTGHRAHLGASLIGEPCARKLWYVFRWVKAESFEARMLRLFNRGHLEEARFIGYLKSVGIEVWEAGEFGDHKGDMRISDHDGHFGGTPDGVGRNSPDLDPNEPFLLEFKTHNGKSFTKLKAEGLMMTKWRHFVQMQVCMSKMGLKFAMYCAVNKDNDDLFIEIISEDGQEGPRAIERAGVIIWSNEPPLRIAKSPASFHCKFCHFSRLCWFGDVRPDRNCRSCKWSRPSAGGDGRWTCMMKQENLSVEAQRAGCHSYSVHESLVGKQP